MLNKLPNVLLCSLSRFKFDYQTMQNTKVHNEWRFPKELELYDYTKKGIKSKSKMKLSRNDSNELNPLELNKQKSSVSQVAMDDEQNSSYKL